MPLNSYRKPLAPVNPAKTLVVGFLIVILIGTALLSLPAATAGSQSASPTTALFTATSAVCVTGLIVEDTATYWSVFGQVVILLLLEIGGLGIMTMSTGVALVLGRRVTLRSRLMIREAMGELSLQGMVRLVRYVLAIALSFQAVGFITLTARLSADYPLGRAAFLGLFHSVSAFNNAGFDLFSTSLEGFVSDPYVNGIIMILIVSGGLGFTVIAELFRRQVRGYRGPLSLHARVVLMTSGVLLAAGTVFFFFSEAGNPETMGELGPLGRVLSAMFTAVTPRTAGFNTLPTGSLRSASLFFLILLMFIGGSPGSTAGGVKTTTVFSMVARIWGTIRGSEDVQVLGRRLPKQILHHSLAIVVLSAALVFFGTLGLLVFEGFTISDSLFEVTSAFGTVGLSTGVTPDLGLFGRLLITGMMFAGRVGPLTLTLALGRNPSKGNLFRYPEEEVMIG
ncbi:MAG: TrkH family potassium uptake protein [Bacillota bacterium]